MPPYAPIQPLDDDKPIVRPHIYSKSHTSRGKSTQLQNKQIQSHDKSGIRQKIQLNKKVKVSNPEIIKPVKRTSLLSYVTPNKPKSMKETKTQSPPKQSKVNKPKSMKELKTRTQPKIAIAKQAKPKSMKETKSKPKSMKEIKTKPKSMKEIKTKPKSMKEIKNKPKSMKEIKNKPKSMKEIKNKASPKQAKSMKPKSMKDIKTKPRLNISNDQPKTVNKPKSMKEKKTKPRPILVKLGKSQSLNDLETVQKAQQQNGYQERQPKSTAELIKKKKRILGIKPKLFKSKAKKTMPKKVKFGTVQIREYSRCLGDNPSAFPDGPSISLDWTYIANVKIPVEKFEKKRQGYRKDEESLLLLGEERTKLIKYHTYCTDEEIEENIRELEIALRKREKSLRTRSLDGFQFVVEMYTRKFQRERKATR